MRSAETQIPIAALPSYLEMDEDDTISWNMELPQSVDTERLTLNGARFRRLQKIAAFRASHIYGYNGDTTLAMPIAATVNCDGTATASKNVVVAKVETTKEVMRDLLPPDVMRQSGKVETVHELNRSELVSHVIDLKQSGVSSDEAWASGLNDAVTSSIRAIAKQHLIDRIGVQGKCFSGILTGTNATIAAAEMQAGDMQSLLQLCSVLGVAALGGNVLDMSANKTNHGDSFRSERRWSISPFPGMQFDRYIAVASLSRALPLISAHK